MIGDAARKMGRIERAKIADSNYAIGTHERNSFEKPSVQDPIPPVPEDHAIELPSGEVTSLYPQPLSKPGPQYPAPNTTYPYRYENNEQDKFSIEPDDPPQYHRHQPRTSQDLPYRNSSELAGTERPATIHGSVPSPRVSDEGYRRPEPPPLPPKTPIQSMGDERRHTSPPRSNGQPYLPYPDMDGPPPIVNMARKPEYSRRP